MNKALLFLEKYLATGLLLLINSTVKVTKIGSPPKEPVIYFIWHRNQIPLGLIHKNQNIGVLISQSNDGELVAGPFSLLGYKPIRGSSRRGGTSALKNLIKHLKRDSVAITPDGPRGPIYKIKDGLLTTAYLSKRTIVPVAVNLNRELVFNSWDRFRFPKLFCHIKIAYGSQYQVKDKADFTNIKDELEKAMLDLEKKITF